MFRARGKPDDPVNIKIAEQYKHLSDAIHVNPLNQIGGTRATNLSEKQRELQRRKQHFNAFRETYQDRLQKYQKKNYNGDETVKTSEFSIKRFFGESPRKEMVNEYKPVYIKAPLKTIKTVTVEIPLVAKQNAVWCPPRLPSTTTVNTTQKIKVQNVQKDTQNKKTEQKPTSDVLQKLKELEKSIKTVEKKDSGIQAAIFKEIEEVNEEIDIAAMQLEHIKSVIGIKKPRVNTSSQSDNKEPDCEKSSTTWMLEHGPKKKEGSGAKRLATTLNVLNQKLQEMQDKFKSKSTYKSIKDYLSARQSVHVLYKNKNFKPKSKVKDLLSDSETDKLLNMILADQEAKCALPHSPQDYNCHIVKVASPKKPDKVVKSLHRTPLTPPADAYDQDEMSAFFDGDLLRSVMKSQFLSKEFRGEVRGHPEQSLKMKKRKTQFPAEHAVFSSADLVRL